MKFATLLTTAALTTHICTAGDRGLPAQEGIGNFGTVDDGLFRGAQPDEAGMKSLERLGVKMVVNLRMPKDVRKTEAAEALACGITYTNLPLGGLGRPSDEDIRRILDLIENSPSPVFVHCEHGCNRTGTVIACYRIEHERWSSAAALKEAQHYGMSSMERGMRKFVEDFGRSQKADARSN